MTVQVEKRLISSVVAHVAELLAAAGVEPAAIDAELIACSVLGIGRTQLHLQGATDVDGRAHRRIVEMATLRSEHRPLQHILGSTGFRKIELAIDARAMIPRPETELLAGAVIDHIEKSTMDPNGVLGSGSDECSGSGSDERSGSGSDERSGSGRAASRHPQVLDLCTGSGAVALSIAAEVPRVRVSASDISPVALELARSNCSNLGLQRRVRFHLGDLYAGVPAELKGEFDVIVANPPYIPTGEIVGLDPEVRDFDPRIALDGGADGLDLTRRILEQAGDWIRPGGLLAMELGPSQTREVEKLATRLGLTALPSGMDYLGVERFFFAVAPPGISAEFKHDSARPQHREAISGVQD